MVVRFVSFLIILLCTATATAGVTSYNTQDRDQWFADVAALGETTSIGFTEFPNNTTIIDQYDELGITFDGFNLTSGPIPPQYQDGWGLRIFNGNDLFFDEPINWIAADFIGTMSIDLYNGDTFIDTVHVGNSGLGQFGGAISTQPFDRVFIYDFFDPLTVLDDLYFGPPIPAPAALCHPRRPIFARTSTLDK